MTSELLSDIGICLNDRQTTVFTSLLSWISYTPDKYNVKSSCGMSIVIVPLCKSRVYQFYLSESTFQKIQTNLQIIQSIDGFVKILDLYPEFNTIVYEKIEPIIDILTNDNVKFKVKETVDVKRLMNDVFQLLVDMKSKNLCHRDLTLDNIGYSKLKDKYLVYDFETIAIDKELAYQNKDMYTFIESIKFHELVKL